MFYISNEMNLEMSVVQTFIMDPRVAYEHQII